MENIFFYFAWFLTCWAISSASGPVKSGCLEREKALTLLETAEDLLSKAENSFPSCNENFNSTDQPECGVNKKAYAYIEVSKKLISDVRENFPTCPKTIQQQIKPRNCFEVLTLDNKENGVYTAWLREPYTMGKPLQVYCDMKTDGGGWTVVQRRGKFPVQLDFYKDWESYKNGFGNLTEEFWLGNENIRVLCHKGCKIRFDLQDKNLEKSFAVYQSFNLTKDKYQIHITNYTGNASDAMQYHNNYAFSTKDSDRDGKAKKHHSGWWHGDRIFCNINGVYQQNSSSTENVYWWSLHENYDNLASVEIKVKPN